MSQAFGFRKTWVLAVMFLIYTFIVATYNSLAPTFIAQTFGIETTQAAQHTSWYSLMMIIGAFIAGAVINVVAKNKKMPAFLILVTVIITISFWMIWNVPSLGVGLTIWMLVIGLLFSFFPPMMFTLCPSTVSKAIYGAAAMALIMLGQKVGAAFGPTVVAAIVEYGGGWGAMTLPSIICGVLLILLAVLFFYFEKHPTASEKEAMDRADAEDAAGMKKKAGEAA